MRIRYCCRLPVVIETDARFVGSDLLSKSPLT